MRLLLLVFWLAVLPAFAEDPRVTSLITQGDSEEKLRHTKAALTALQQAEQLEPNNVGVLLRIAKQYSDLTSDAKSPAIAEQNALKSLEYSKRAVALDPTSAKAHLSVAVGYGKLTDFVSNKTKIEYSKSIKEFTEKSIALDASDDFAWHVLGRWHFGVANVGAVLRALARMVYGGLPPATNEDAARCLKKATELAPQKIIHRAALARVYKAMGKHELEVKEWQSILTLPALDKEDEQEKREAQQALASR